MADTPSSPDHTSRKAWRNWLDGTFIDLDPFSKSGVRIRLSHEHLPGHAAVVMVVDEDTTHDELKAAIPLVLHH